MRCCPAACPQLELLKFAMHGEAVACGSMHVDNIAPSLFGGLVLTVGIDNPHVKQIPVPRGDARGDGPSAPVPVHQGGSRHPAQQSSRWSDFVWQTAHLAGFISGCYTDDIEMIRASLEDVVIEPQRAGADSGFRRCAPRRHGDRRAGLLDFRCRAHGIRLVPGAPGGRGAGGHARGVRAPQRADR